MPASFYPRVENWVNIKRQSDGTKPHTSYRISFTSPHSPDQRRTIQKRYSDFVALDQALRQVAGYAPPKPLPSKILTYWPWIRTGTDVALSPSISNRDLTLVNNRAGGLEQYLTALDGSDDPIWKLSNAWKNFWNLATNASDFGSRAVSDQDDVALDPAKVTPALWLDLLDQLTSGLQSVRFLLAKRNVTGGGQTSDRSSFASSYLARNTSSALGSDSTSLVRQASERLEKCKNLLYLLSTSLFFHQEKKALNVREHHRRSNLLSNERNEFESLEDELVAATSSFGGRNSDPSKKAGRREVVPRRGRVLGRAPGSTPPSGGPSRAPEAEDTSNMDAQQLYDSAEDGTKLQERILQGFLATAREYGVGARQLQSAVAAQDPLLDQLGGAIDSTGSNIRKARRGIDRLGK